MKKSLLTLSTAATIATLVPANSADAAAELRTDISTASTQSYQAPVTQTTNTTSYTTTSTSFTTNAPVASVQNEATTTTTVQKAPTSVAVNNDVASVALSIAAGKSYVFGANSASAVDCSSFAQQVLAAMGKSVPRTTYAQAAAGTQVSNPQPGDLVFFNNYSHVGVYIGGGQMVDALNPSAGIGQRAVSYISGSVDGYYRF